ncbi:MAG: UvrD-helicase domain-containing protein [Roseibacillus sp.]|nr:UvrD-helicase domain-containing protein [Roseibacillus sp.]
MISPLQNERILASAGSGKTWQLTNRYIAIMGQALLAKEEIHPERIVAVTFTRKAAGEFFESILGKLASAALDEKARAALAQDPDDPSYPILSRLEQEDYVHLLSVFLKRMPSLFLGTLDSFFSNILRSFPAEFGLSSQFDILDEHAAHLARHDVYREVFRSRHDQHRSEFLEAFKRATFGQEEAQVINQLDRFVSRHHGIFLHAADHALWGNPATIWPRGCPWSGGSGTHEDDFTNLFDIFEDQELSEKQWDYWREFRDQALTHSPGNPLPRRILFFLEKFLDPGNWAAIQAGESSFKVGHRLQAFESNTCDIIHRLTTRLISHEIAVHLKRTQGVWHVLNQYERNYSSLVRRRGQLTFSDLEIILSGCDLHAQSAPVLSQKPDELERLRIDYRLDGRFDHWLLDEFQDTSYLQWSIIESLIDEVIQDVSQNRSLFQVGDIKQAIYAWRGGDTRLFDDIHKRYGGTEDDPRSLRSRSLDVSWRSGGDVIDMVNNVFSDTRALEALEMPGDTISRWDWNPHEVAPPNRDLPGYAAFYQPIPEEGSNAKREDCFALTLELLEEIQPITRGLSCAILVQDNRTGRDIVDYLRAHTRSGIPVAGEAEISPALDNPVTQALLSLIRVAAHPANRYAWRHLTFCPLAALLPPEPAALSAEVLESLHHRGYEHTLKDWIKRFENAGIALDAFAAHRITELTLAARIFDQAGNGSPDQFLRFAENYTVRGVTTSAAVQVMTIHKAKGLTFDTVLLPSLDGDSLTVPRRDSGHIAVHHDRDTRDTEWVFDIPRRIISDTDPVLHSYWQEQEAEAAYEQLCKFYVGLTRARHANYLIAPGLPARSTKRNFIRLLHETIADDNPPTVEIGRTHALALYESSGDTADPKWFEAHKHRQPPESPEDEKHAPPDPEPRVQPRRHIPSAPGSGNLAGSSLFSRESHRARNHGTMVHALLEDIEWLDDFDPHGEVPHWEVLRQRAPHLFEAAREEVRRSLADPSFQKVLNRPRLRKNETIECWRERHYELLQEGNWISGIFDRVHVTYGSDGMPLRATILDFKTDRMETRSDAADAAEHYQAQLRSYREAITRLLGLPPARITTLLLFTRLPLVMEINP